jgi:hypothetical protein
VRAKPTGLGQPNEDGAYDRSSNAARPGADAEEQESLLAEQHGLGNNLAERKVRAAWPGRLTLRLCKCNDFNENGLFGRDRDLGFVISKAEMMRTAYQ